MVKNSLQRSLSSLMNFLIIAFASKWPLCDMAHAEGVKCRLQVRDVGHWFTISETTQTSKNVNLRPKYYFLVLVLALVKAWGLSALVKQWPATLTCNLQFTPSVAPGWLGNLKEASPLSLYQKGIQCSYYFFYHFCCISHFMSKAQELLFHKILVVKKS